MLRERIGEGTGKQLERRLPVGEDTEIRVTLDDFAREGARRMIAAALKVEADEYVERFTDEVDEDGKRLVVRNGRAGSAGSRPGRAPWRSERITSLGSFSPRAFRSRITEAPRLGALAVAVLDRQQLLGGVLAHTDHDEQASPIVLAELTETWTPSTNQYA
jgi:hypothetical protein